MTRVVQQIRTEPDGNPAVGIQTRVLKVSDNTQLGGTETSDSNGLVFFESNGSPGPITLRIEGRPGGDRSLASGEAMTSGVFSPAELPAALTVQGDGVIRGYLNEMTVTVSEESATVSSGAALVAGYPVVFYSAVGPIDLPPTGASTRVDRIVVFIEPATGLAGVERLPGTEGSETPPALNQTVGRYEIGLATISVGILPPIAQPVDERLFSGDRLDVVGTDRVSSATTTSVPGAAITDLAVTLVLPRAVTYDVEAEITGQQVGVTPTSAWALQATYGPTFNALAMSNPGQVAIESTNGWVIVADTGNNRYVYLNLATGAYVTFGALTGVTGVAYSATNQTTVLVYGTTITVSSDLGDNTRALAATGRHVATDGTYAYVTLANHTIAKYSVNPATGLVATFGSPGSTDGKFNTPTGICVDGAYVWVADTGNTRLQQFSLAGSFVGKFSTPSPPSGITSIPTASILIVSFTAEGVVRRYVADATGSLVDSFSHPSPLGVDVTRDGTDIIWVSNTSAGTIAKWDEAISPGGHGQIAVELDGTVSAYTGIGARTGAVANSATGTKAGPGSVLVRGFAKSTLNTTSLSGLTLSARATPRG